ncbi:hypothetical protein AX14_001974 [Amanita brunnescens Koide BX004]|jgi:N-alpha-acetyltransferase 40|nr:hypothetical protein AX14_001974 [Amanita brunnescens Koide BX004]
MHDLYVGQVLWLEVWRRLTSISYAASSFGWNPMDKRKEMFHAKSRVLTVFKEMDLVAYCMFRFEVEESSGVLYWYQSRLVDVNVLITRSYELQVSSTARRRGLGKMLMQQLWKIGSSWKMEKIMLTVLKGQR